MIIEEKNIYVFEEKEYKNIEDVRRHLEDEIGNIIDDDKSFAVPPKIALSILSNIIKNRDRLIKLLSVEFETTTESSDWASIRFVNKNIFSTKNTVDNKYTQIKRKLTR